MVTYTELQDVIIYYMDRYPVENETDFNMFAVDFTELFCLIMEDLAEDHGWEFEGI